MEIKREKDRERSLAQKARNGDSEAFEDLVRIHQRALYAFLYRLSGNMHDAQEVSQQSFIKAYLAMASFRGEASFKTWLYRIAVNTFRNYVRDEGRRRHLALDENIHSTDEGAFSLVAGNQERSMLEKAIDTLPARQREALVLRVNEGYRFTEVARVMNCSVGAAKASYHQAVRKLKAAVGGDRR